MGLAKSPAGLITGTLRGNFMSKQELFAHKIYLSFNSKDLTGLAPCYQGSYTQETIAGKRTRPMVELGVKFLSFGA